MTIQQFISQAKEEGFSVYAPEKLSSYFYFSKDNKIGYCQYNNFRGVSFSTIHKGNPHTGTGFTVSSFDEALCIRPHWAGDTPVIKFNSMADFLNNHWQPLVEI